MEKLVSNIAIGIARHVISALGALLVAHGILDQANADQAAGAALILITVALSAWDKVHAKRKVEVAAQAPATDDLKGLY